jgi:hypothetical protein
MWDAPDELLRALSPEYVGSCFEKLAAHLRSLGEKPGHLRFGWLHPGVAVVPSGRESPLSYVGWLWANRRPRLTEGREALLAEALLAESPRLRWAASYRSGVFDCDPVNPAEVLAAMRQYVLDDPSAGDPEWLARGAGGSVVIDGLVEACARRERAEVMLALERAAGLYSPEGADLLRVAVLQWLHGPDGARP